MSVYEVRAAIVAVLRAAAALECGCPGTRRVAGLAGELLREVSASGLHITRWRNPERGPWEGTLHVAGPVWTCREHRRSRPQFVVDARQACTRCGRELVRGKHGLWFPPGEPVITDEYSRAPLQLWAWRRIGGSLWEGLHISARLGANRA